VLEDLTGRVAVVTGGASGIGWAMAERFAAEGMKVVVADLRLGAVEQAAEALRATGAEALGVRADVGSAEDVEALAAAAYDAFGAVHVLCNNAGVVSRGAAWEESEASWRWALDVLLWGPIHGVRSFVPRMLAAGEPGHVVNTASAAGLVTFRSLAPYLVGKQGVVALSESVRADLAARRAPIGVSVLCPGVVATSLAETTRLVRPGGDPEAPVGESLLSGAEAISPAEVAAAVVDAVRTDRFWILTHPRYGELYLERARSAVEGTEPPVATPER
jgi:NAD(P)-dependent dehydrogenase (short-subunit alcohol dehydrogenase family)